MTNSQLPTSARAIPYGLLGIWVLGFGIWIDAHNPITTKVTWAREIAPLVTRRCASCHMRGGFAFSLTTYDDARPWAVAIKEVVLAGEMPPWGAAPGVGHFANDRSLTRHEMELIAAWVDGGAPRETPNSQGPNSQGPNSQTAGVGSSAVGSWTLGIDGGTLVPLASAVIATAMQRTASVTLQLPAGLSLVAWTFDPGTPAIVERADLELGTRWLGTWTPGDRAVEYPANAGVPLGGSALFTARIVYRAPAARVLDHSGFRIWTTKESRARTIREATVVRSWRPTNAVEMFALRPAGTDDVEAVARFANGRIEPLGTFRAPARAPHPTYRFARPIALAAGARVEVTKPVRLLYTDGATRTVKPNVRRRPRR
jgi:mono/diheme cytochrome c family protein